MWFHGSDCRYRLWCLCAMFSNFRSATMLRLWIQEKMIPHTNSFPLNPLHCAYFINTKLNKWFSLLENKFSLVYKHFHYLNRCIYNKKQMSKLKLCIHAATRRNVSWVISNMAANHNPHFFGWFPILLWRYMK